MAAYLCGNAGIVLHSYIIALGRGTLHLAIIVAHYRCFANIGILIVISTAEDRTTLFGSTHYTKMAVVRLYNNAFRSGFWGYSY
jgi:hypothetical protein